MTFESVVKELGIEAYPPVLKEMFVKMAVCVIEK